MHTYTNITHTEPHTDNTYTNITHTEPHTDNTHTHTHTPTRTHNDTHTFTLYSSVSLWNRILSAVSSLSQCARSSDVRFAHMPLNACHVLSDCVLTNYACECMCVFC